MNEKKVHILKNVGKLYLKYGIRSVTMDDVASELGISKKTLYQYFKDKKDLVTQTLNYFMENPPFQVDKLNQENAIERLFSQRRHFSTIFKHLNNNLEFDLKKQYPQLYKKVRNHKRERIFSDTLKNVSDGIKQGLYRKDLDGSFVSKIQVGRMLCSFNPDNEIFDETEVASLENFDKIMDYHFHAICTPKGIEEYKKQLNKVQNENQN